MKYWVIIATGAGLVALLGCEASEAPKSQAQVNTIEVDAEVSQRAKQASQALFQALSGRLMEVISKQGPGEAIVVCSDEATRIAERVGKEQGVKIGRTSFKLRNAKNQPPAWARPLVKARVEEPSFVELADDRVGALLPIRLKQNCLLCHGAKDQIPAEVGNRLAVLYPKDQATGFQEGDLRGWFWIEMPEATEDAAEAESNASDQQDDAMPPA